MTGSLRVGVLGASGFAGGELLRLLSAHPCFEVALATGESTEGARVADAHPGLRRAYPSLTFARNDPAVADGLDAVFLALPHGVSQRLVPDLRDRVGMIVDLSGDFRLRDASLYPRWYGEDHACPELLDEARHGIPELFRDQLRGARLVAAAGCYVTAAALALAPLVRTRSIEPTGVVVDAASGVSGAGRASGARTHFNSIDEDFSAYGLLDHRHTPEIEQAIGAQVIFTPHLAPMNRGILATCYARPTPGASDPLEVLSRHYRDEPFVVVSTASPSTKASLGSNCAYLTARHDTRTGWVVVICALDNLTKGAAGQAIQCANVAIGLPETAGLPVAGVYP